MNMERGTILGHYDILSKIGEAGMGEVYLALDTKLGRKVALKILPAEVDSNQKYLKLAKAPEKLAAPEFVELLLRGMKL